MTELEKIQAARKYAAEFLLRADIRIAEIKVKPDYYPSKNRASLKRISMDLTRALAELRKSGS